MAKASKVKDDMQQDWPILILTLEGDDTRREPLLAQLKAAGLSFELFYGVDGRQGLPQEQLVKIDRPTAEKRLKRPMTDPEFACALSHRSIYQSILDRGLSGAVVLEDDAILTPDFAIFLRNGFHRTESMVMMDYRYGRALLWQHKKIGSWAIYRAAQRATLASAYSVSRRSAQALLDAATPVSFVADWPVDLHDLEAWLVVPRVVEHNEPGQGPSHLDATRLEVPAKHKHPGRYLESRYWTTFLRRKLARKVGR